MSDQTGDFPGSQFDKNDLQEFAADDAEVGGNIGKMLTIFFFYSLLIMAAVTFWTGFVAK